MKRKMGELLFRRGTIAGIFILGFALLLYAGTSGAKAAFLYRAQMNDTSLMENDVRIAWSDYSGNGGRKDHMGVLLEHLLPENGRLKPGQVYPEELKVSNSGTADQYIRVTVSRYWTDQKGNRLQNMSPALIDLNLVNLGSDWLIDEDSSTKEKTVLYYSQALGVGCSTPLFADRITINQQMADRMERDARQDESGVTVQAACDDTGLIFCLEMSVDAVQDIEVQEGIWSTGIWGVSGSL